jgi:hypothetical protein
MNPSMYIVTEGELDKSVLEAVLPLHWQSEIRMAAAGGLSGAYGLASTLLSKRQKPVILLVDADSTNPSVVQERQDFADSWIKRASATRIPYLVVVAVPEIEAIVLNDREILEQFASRDFTPFEWQAAQRDPKGFTQEIFKDQNQMLQLLATHREKYASHPIVNKMTDFVSQFKLADAAD